MPTAEVINMYNLKPEEMDNMPDWKISVYEFVGYLNTPDECRGHWFEDFPYKMDGRYIEPRVNINYEYPNWQAYVISGRLRKSKDKELGDWVTDNPIQLITFRELKVPKLAIHKGRTFAVHRDGYFNYHTIWEVEQVHQFMTAAGERIYSTVE